MGEGKKHNIRIQMKINCDLDMTSRECAVVRKMKFTDYVRMALKRENERTQEMWEKRKENSEPFFAEEDDETVKSDLEEAENLVAEWKNEPLTEQLKKLREKGQRTKSTKSTL